MDQAATSSNEPEYDNDTLKPIPDQLLDQSSLSKYMHMNRINWLAARYLVSMPNRLAITVHVQIV